MVLGSLVILSFCLIIALTWHTRDRVIESTIEKAQSDLATSMEIVDLSYPGEWHLESGKLFKGQESINNNTALIDRLATLTGNSITIFQGGTRIATTYLNNDGSRAVGTRVSAQVAEKVLQKGESYVGAANVLGNTYQTVYQPLHDPSGKIIGIFYVGISNSYVETIIKHFWIQSVLIGTFITILIGIAALIFLKRFIIQPLRTITSSTRDVASGHPTSKIKVKKGPKEINDLTLAFNQLVETMDVLTHQLSQVQTKPEAVTVEAEEAAQSVGTAENGERPSINCPLASSETTPDNFITLPRCTVCAVPFVHRPSSPSSEINGSDAWDFNSADLPKGFNSSTLRQITQHLQIANRPVSADDVAEGVNLSRVTVKRYLEFLEHKGYLFSELKYGTIGRPVKIFSIDPINLGGDDLV